MNEEETTAEKALEAYLLQIRNEIEKIESIFKEKFETDLTVEQIFSMHKEAHAFFNNRTSKMPKVFETTSYYFQLHVYERVISICLDFLNRFQNSVLEYRRIRKEDPNSQNQH